MSEARRNRGEQAFRRGRWAERLCRLSLLLRGWSILATDVRGLPGSGVGEVDIIARRGSILAFIEVKARPTLAQAAEAISQQQQRRLVRAAERFLAAYPCYAVHQIRFDAMLVQPWRWPHHLPDAWR